VSEFAGAVYDEAQDKARLEKQMILIRDFMLGTGLYWTVQEIESQLTTKYGIPFPQNSIQAQLRNLEKAENGGYDKDKRRRDGTNLWEYKLMPSQDGGKKKKALAPTKKEKGLILEEILEMLEGKKPSQGMMKLIRWLSDGSA
jgi:hypothetical protein